MKLLLVDGTNLVLRYAFAKLGDLQAEHSEQAIQGVLAASLDRIVECCFVVRATHAIICFDSPESTWRREIYPAYKITRAKIEFPWSSRMAEFLAAARWRCLALPRYEADDLIATLAARASEKGHLTAILSSDSDLLQLASETCDIYQYGASGEPRFVRRSEEWIAAKYQIRSVAQLRMFKALAGESGDNLPGVGGIGPVKARQLIALHGDPETLLASSELRASKQAEFRLALQLVTLRDNVPIEAVKPAECRVVRG